MTVIRGLRATRLGWWGRRVGGALDGAEDGADLVGEGGEGLGEDGAARVEDDVDGAVVEEREVGADGLAHAALDAVAVDGFAEGFGDGEADSGAQREAGVVRAEGDEEAHLTGELFAAGGVHALVVGVFAEPEDLGDGHSVSVVVSG